MKLNKHICKKCRDEFGDIGWFKERDDYYWKRNIILCPGKILPKIYHSAPFFKTKTDEKIPDYCPFKLEHLVNIK